jgi:protease-4
MDFEQHNNSSQPSPSYEPMPAKQKKRSGWRVFWGVFISFSVLANVMLFFALIALSLVFVTGQRGIFTEQVIQPGSKKAKIAVISVQGIIDSQVADDFYNQLKVARQDNKVKGLIIRVNSPGGTVSASDRIYNEIQKYRDLTNKPVVAMAQAVAASGGYYACVACEKIVAEPTLITGSIGVIMGHFVLQELLEEKLGIVPVIIKSGEKKDWPSPFSPVTDEQRQYLQAKIIEPAYERFVMIVDQGRASLDIEQVKRLADGSIYGADESLDEGLIDSIGYLDDAIAMVEKMAGIDKAHVIEYRKPFSMSDMFGAQSGSLLRFDKAAIYELNIPQVMYLWPGY